jgi:hypothetical protein
VVMRDPRVKVVIGASPGRLTTNLPGET